jgi:hypothetical protein
MTPGIKLGLYLLITLLPSLNGVSNQADPYKWEARVKVECGGSDSSIKNEVLSYINRELRELSGVVVVNSDPEYEISIIPAEPRLENGRSVGYVLSVVITQKVSTSASEFLIDYLLKDKEVEKKAILKRVKEDAAAGVIIFTHVVYTVGKDSLKSTCKELVASFDVEILEISRKAHQEVMDKYAKPNKKPEK